jgi:hypothetical protein
MHCFLESGKSSCSVSQAIVDLQAIEHMLSASDFVLVIVWEVLQH